MANAEAERYKIEWFYGIDLFLKSKEGEKLLVDVFGNVARRDEVEYKVFLMLLETVITVGADLHWDEEYSLSRWRSMHRENARNNYLTGRFARNDFWDKRAWDERYEELRQYAEKAAPAINQFIQNKKDKLENDMQNERHTPIIPVTEEDLELCAKPSDTVTLQCENDPEAMERVRKYLEAVGSNQAWLYRQVEAIASVPDANRHKTIFPPSSMPPAGVCLEAKLPKDNAPSIIPDKKEDSHEPEILFFYEDKDQD